MSSGPAMPDPSAPEGLPPATGRRRVVAVVPAKDRADSVGATVRALAAIAAVDDVLVVDDGSSDGTAAAARAAGAWVLRLAENVGKGGAVAAAVAASPETDVYLLVDADTGASARATEALLHPVLAGDADMTIAVLPSAAGRGGLGTVRRLAGTGIRLGARGFFPDAPLSGQRAVRGPLLRSLDLAPRFGLEVGLTVDAWRAGARVVELPVEMEHRHTGRSLAGFRHRGRQGVDAARALWPRLTTARARTAFVLVALLVAMGAATWSAGRAVPASVAPTALAAKVLLVGVPGLAWDDIGTGSMPNLDRLAAGGAVAAMNVRTRSAKPTVGEGYATLGAGSRVGAGDAADGALATGDGGVVVPGAPGLRAHAGAHLPTGPGALGDALHAAGRRTAVVGNADLAPGLVGLELFGHPNLSRPAAVALMDGAGVVDAGTVTFDELVAAAKEPAAFGHRADVGAVAARAREALEEADVVLVDSGDLDRAAALRENGAPRSYAGRARAGAIAATDDLVGRLSADLPPRTLLMVVSVTPPEEEWRLTPVVASGAGVVHGYLESPSTRRVGLVTLTDVGPTVLGALGLPVPAAMPGRALRFSPADSPNVARLSRLDRDAAWRERVWLPVTVAFIAAQVLLWAVTAMALTLPRRAGWIRRAWLRAAAVGVAAFPLAALVLRAVPGVAGWGGGGVAALVALDVALAALALRCRSSASAPVRVLLVATVALVLVDVATGARLQLAGILGYSPQSASRFFGLGNTAFGVLAGAAVLVAALHVERALRPREAVVGAAALLALVAFVDGAPFLGADVGGLVALVPVYALAVVALSGRRPTWRTATLAAGGTVALVGLAAAVDLLRPPESRTHLGRLASATLHGGEGSLLSTVARKVEVNLGVTGRSFWTAVTPVIAVAVLAVVLRSPAARRLLAPGSPARIGVVGALAAGLLGYAVNDSGVIVVAMVLVEVGPFLALLALRERRPGPVLLEPANEPAGVVGG